MLTTFIIDAGIPAIFLLMVADAAFVPAPSEVTMLVGGAAAGGAIAGAHLNIWAVIVAGTLGNVVGSYLAWCVGRFGGRAAVHRWGRFVRLNDAHLDRIHDWFGRYGTALVLLGRLVPVVRTFISLPAGIAQMPVRRYGAYTLVGCLAWCAGLAYAGYSIGGDWQSVEESLLGHACVIAAGIVSIGVIAGMAHSVRPDRARTSDAAVL